MVVWASHALDSKLTVTSGEQREFRSDGAMTNDGLESNRTGCVKPYTSLSYVWKARYRVVAPRGQCCPWVVGSGVSLRACWRGRSLWADRMGVVAVAGGP